VNQLSGGLSGEVRSTRSLLLQIQAHIVASIDFPEDEIPSINVANSLEQVHLVLENLLRGADRGIVYRQGVRTALIGRPNVGKSSLLNALLRTNRAIVTPIPGTTRDTVEEMLNLQGIPIVLVDTAGMDSDPRDAIEQLGIERSRQALQQADLVLLVLDGSAPLGPADEEILGLLGDRPSLIAVNKSDLPLILNLEQLPVALPRLVVSAQTGEGLVEVEAAIVEMILGGKVQARDDVLVSNPRHKAALSLALESVSAALNAHLAGTPVDFISIDLAEALEQFGQITGETADEELLDQIFADFCIGK
jgi:tRNA modification GTPase